MKNYVFTVLDFFSHSLALQPKTSQDCLQDTSSMLLAALRKIASVLPKMWGSKIAADDHVFARIILANNESYRFVVRRETVVDLDEEEKENYTIQKFSESSQQLAADQPRAKTVSVSAKRVLEEDLALSPTPKKQALEAPTRQLTRPSLPHCPKPNQQSAVRHDRAHSLARYISEYVPFGKPLCEFTDEELEYMVAQHKVAVSSLRFELGKRAEEREQNLPRNASRRWHGPRMPDL